MFMNSLQISKINFRKNTNSMIFNEFDWNVFNKHLQMNRMSMIHLSTSAQPIIAVNHFFQAADPFIENLKIQIDLILDFELETRG